MSTMVEKATANLICAKKQRRNEEKMSEFENNYGNPEVQYSASAPEPKKKHIGLLIGIILCAIVMAACGAGAYVQYINDVKAEESEELSDIYFAEEEGEHCYALLQYMTEPFASFELDEQQQLYFIFDEEFYPAIICMRDADAEELHTYLEYTYTDDESYPVPEQKELTGYSVKMDSEIVDLAIECYNDIFEYEYTEEEFFTDFGHYYLNIGANPAGASFGMSPMLLVCVIAAVLLIILIIFYVRALSGKKGSGNILDVNLTQSVPGEQSAINRGAGLVGALLGALLGGVAWVIIGLLGYVVGWIGILIICLAVTGYKKLAKGLDKIGVVCSVIVSLIVIVGAVYMVWVCAIYGELSGTAMQRTLPEVMVHLPYMLSVTDSWGNFAADLILGFALTGVAGVYYGGSLLNKNNNNNQVLKYKVEPKVAKLVIGFVVIMMAWVIAIIVLAVMEVSGFAAPLLMVGGMAATIIWLCCVSNKMWSKAVFYDEEQFRIGKSTKAAVRSYREIVSMSQDEAGNYVIKLYSGDSVTIPAKYRGADQFAALVTEKLREQWQ